MGRIANWLGIKAYSAEDPSSPLLPASSVFESLGLGRSDSGMLVNEKQAMRLAPAYTCIKVISEDLGRLPIDIFQELPDGSMRKAKEHSLYNLIHTRPNPNMSSMVWRGAMIASANAYGNSYSLIKRTPGAKPLALIPLASDRTSPVYVNGELMYATTQTQNGQAAHIDPANILHFQGLTLDGIVGLSPIQTCKNAFGLAAAAEKFGCQLFANGARATGVLSHPNTLDPEAYENLKKSVREWATGEQAMRPIILEEGMKWEQISIPPEDAQFIQTRKLQKEEIACLFRVPMHLLQDLLRATNNNIEHQGLDYVRFCLAPWAVRMEQEINYKLLGGSYTVEHNFNDIQRGDFQTQTAGFQTLRNIGVYSANDILRAMRQNPIPVEEGGDVRTVQGAMIPLSSLVNQESTPEDTNTNADEGNPAASARQPQILAAYRPLFRDAVGRAINRQGDGEFTRKAINPAINSMCQAIFAMRFGNCELTKANLDQISALTTEIAANAAAWKRNDASTIASQVTEQVYTALSGSILS